MKFFFTLLLYFLSLFTQAQSVLQIAWDFNGNAGNEISVAPITIDPNLSPVLLQRGAGLNAASLANSFNSSGWTMSNSLLDAIGNNDFLEWVLQPQSGFVSSLHQLTATFRRSSTGPDHFQWRYSIDGSTFLDLGSEILFQSTATNGVVQLPIDLLGVPSLQTVTSAASIHFRLYGYNATATSGSFALGRLSGSDLSLTGSTQALTPQVLLYFNVRQNIGNVDLTWEVTAETGVAKYVVERSGPDGNFIVIGERQALNHSVATKYQFPDKQPLLSTAFYRLRMLDNDGRFSYSTVQKLDPVSNRTGFRVVRFSARQTMLQFSGGHVGGSLRLISLDGRVLRNWSVSRNQEQLILATEELIPGLYILQFKTGQGLYVGKIYL